MPTNEEQEATRERVYRYAVTVTYGRTKFHRVIALNVLRPGDAIRSALEQIEDETGECFWQTGDGSMSGGDALTVEVVKTR